MESDDSGEIGYIENSQTPSQMTPMDNSSDDTQQTKQVTGIDLKTTQA